MMTSFLNEFFKRALTSVGLIFCLGGAYIHSPVLFSLFLAAILLIILAFEWPQLLDKSNKILFLLITLIYPILPAGCLIYLNLCYRKYHLLLPLYPFCIAWTYDTCGYFVGKAFGKHKICPSISPGKSWEGLFGGFLGIIAVNYYFFSYIITSDQQPFFIILVSFLLTLLAFAGGTLISYLKRKKNLKDTGSVLPGHGGFLDRFDSVFFIAVATAIGIIFLK